MQVFNTVSALNSFLEENKVVGFRLGLVPTMGALHEGHLALIRQSVEENELTVCSIFVNPIQFNNAEDLEKYPRVMDADIALLKTFPGLVVFAPSSPEMYPQKPLIHFDFGALGQVMEGKFRTGHFNGVAIVVSKLFHMVQPNRAYFGQKDLQQCMVIRRLIEDLSFPIELKICDTIREPDGLALSSRNRRLNPSERQAAPAIYQALSLARDHILSDPQNRAAFFEESEAILKKANFQVEYFQLVDLHSLEEVQVPEAKQTLALCIAGYLGSVRLLDNLIFSLADKKNV